MTWIGHELRQDGCVVGGGWSVRSSPLDFPRHRIRLLRAPIRQAVFQYLNRADRLGSQILTHIMIGADDGWANQRGIAMAIDLNY